MIWLIIETGNTSFGHCETKAKIKEGYYTNKYLEK